MADEIAVTVEVPTPNPEPAAAASPEPSTDLAVMVGELRAKVETMGTELAELKGSTQAAQGTADYAARTAERAETEVREAVAETVIAETEVEPVAETVVEFPPSDAVEDAPAMPKTSRGILARLFLG